MHVRPLIFIFCAAVGVIAISSERTFGEHCLINVVAPCGQYESHWCNEPSPDCGFARTVNYVAWVAEAPFGVIGHNSVDMWEEWKPCTWRIECEYVPDWDDCDLSDNDEDIQPGPDTLHKHAQGEPCQGGHSAEGAIEPSSEFRAIAAAVGGDAQDAHRVAAQGAISHRRNFERLPRQLRGDEPAAVHSVAARSDEDGRGVSQSSSGFGCGCPEKDQEEAESTALASDL